MKLFTRNRNTLSHLNLFAIAGDEASPGEGNPGKSSGENNTGNNTPNYANIWDNTSEDGNGAGNTSANNQPQPHSAQKSADDIFNEHVGTLGFDSGTDDLLAAFDSRDSKAFAKAMSGTLSKVYKAAMIDANKLLKANNEKMASQFQSETTRTVDNAKLLDRMNSDLPYTKDPGYAPLAKAVLNQFLTQKTNGKQMSPDEAIKETGKYFEQMAKKISGKSMSPKDFGTGSRKSGRNESAESNDDLDFVALFGGPKAE